MCTRNGTPRREKTLSDTNVYALKIRVSGFNSLPGHSIEIFAEQKVSFTEGASRDAPSVRICVLLSNLLIPTDDFGYWERDVMLMLTGVASSATRPCRCPAAIGNTRCPAEMLGACLLLGSQPSSSQSVSAPARLRGSGRYSSGRFGSLAHPSRHARRRDPRSARSS